MSNSNLYVITPEGWSYVKKMGSGVGGNKYGRLDCPIIRITESPQLNEITLFRKSKFACAIWRSQIKFLKTNKYIAPLEKVWWLHDSTTGKIYYKLLDIKNDWNSVLCYYCRGDFKSKKGWWGTNWFNLLKVIDVQ